MTASRLYLLEVINCSLIPLGVKSFGPTLSGKAARNTQGYSGSAQQMLKCNQDSTGGQSTTELTFSPQNFMKDLWELTEDGLYTFENPKYGKLRVLKKEADLFFCLNDAGEILNLATPKTSLNKLLKKYEENWVDTGWVNCVYPIPDALGHLRDSQMIQEYVFTTSFFSRKKPIGFKSRPWVTRVLKKGTTRVVISC